MGEPVQPNCADFLFSGGQDGYITGARDSRKFLVPGIRGATTCRQQLYFVVQVSSGRRSPPVEVARVDGSRSGRVKLPLTDADDPAMLIQLASGGVRRHKQCIWFTRYISPRTKNRLGVPVTTVLSRRRDGRGAGRPLLRIRFPRSRLRVAG